MTSDYNLEHFWPYHINTDGDWETDSTLVMSLQISKFDPESQGFLVTSRPHFDISDAAVPHILIPPRYKNGFRLINAKISFLQQCARLLSAPVPDETPGDGKENVRLALDSVIRNLVFNVAVRTKFLGGVSDHFYKGSAFRRTRKKLVASLNSNYTCLIMNSWLYCEFRCGHHEPRYVKENLGMVDWNKVDVLDDGEVALTLFW
jgi:hypothetical protein